MLSDVYAHLSIHDALYHLDLTRRKKFIFHGRAKVILVLVPFGALDFVSIFNTITLMRRS